MTGLETKVFISSENKGDFRMNENDISSIPEQYRPISMWGYFGYEFLFNIPIIGLIFLIVFSFGKNRNKNLKNFARSYFCMLIIIIIVAIILMASGVSEGFLEHLAGKA